MKISYNDFCNDYNVLHHRAFKSSDDTIVVVALAEGAVDDYGAHDGYIVVVMELADDGDFWTDEFCRMYLHSCDLKTAEQVFKSQFLLTAEAILKYKKCKVEELQEQILQLEKELQEMQEYTMPSECFGMTVKDSSCGSEQVRDVSLKA